MRDLESFDLLLADKQGDASISGDYSVIAELRDNALLPDSVREVSRFGKIVTLRVNKDNLSDVIESESIHDFQLSRQLAGPDIHSIDKSKPETHTHYERRTNTLLETGNGVVVGVIDWGLDFTLPNFRDDDGNTRILALWDQRGAQDTPSNRFGYGSIHNRDQINSALQKNDPFAELNYYPHDSDSKKRGRWRGTHGTHVADIAVGSQQAQGMSGVAPNADLVFVHLAKTSDVLGTENLGDSASILEAIDFIFQTAEGRPCVINMSVGAHGGPHDGSTLVEKGIDEAVWLKDGRAIVNSAGNYYSAEAHHNGRLNQGSTNTIIVEVPSFDSTPSEIELYYDSVDQFQCELHGPHGGKFFTINIGEAQDIVYEGKKIGRAIHKEKRIANGNRHIDILLYPFAPEGKWNIQLHGTRITDGRYHAWIERDRGKRPRFSSEQSDGKFTTGTLCNGNFSITVGAYDPLSENSSLGRFSSSGPTRDGRIKPELVAPGVDIIAARSSAPDDDHQSKYTRKSGTSMAAPHVAGTIALMFEAADKPLSINETRALLFSSLNKSEPHNHEADIHRLGFGYLDTSQAVKSVKRFVAGEQPTNEGMAMEKTLTNSESTTTEDVNDRYQDLYLSPQPSVSTNENFASDLTGFLINQAVSASLNNNASEEQVTHERFHFSGNSLPVVLVPGIMGTRLVNRSGDLVWDPDRGIRGILPRIREALDLSRPLFPAPRAHSSGLEGLLRARGVVNGGNMVWDEGYNNLVMALSDPAFLRECGHRIKIYCAGYDWRHSNMRSTRALQSVVQRALRETGASQVILVAHSMGGVVSRLFCRSSRINGQPALNAVSKFMLLGSPIHGASKAYRILRQSFSSPDEISDVNLPLGEGVVADFGGRAVARLIQHLPSLTELLPTEAFCRSNPNWLIFNTSRAGLRDASNPRLLYRNRVTGVNISPALLRHRDHFDRTLGAWLPPQTIIFHSSELTTETRYEIDRWGNLNNIGSELDNRGDGTVPNFSGSGAANHHPSLTRIDMRRESHGDLANGFPTINEIKNQIRQVCQQSSAGDELTFPKVG